MYIAWIGRGASPSSRYFACLPGCGAACRAQERLDWLLGRLSVPQVLGYAAEDGREYLLLSAIPGIGTSSETLGMENLDVVRLLAQGLRMVHEVPIRDCPFDMTLDRVLPQTEQNVRLGLVDEDEFDRAVGRGLVDRDTACRAREEADRLLSQAR